MRVGVIVPDRGDRKDFKQHCYWLLLQQTFKGFSIYSPDFRAEDGVPDLTKRVRAAYEMASQYNDVVCIMENDDWYSKDYLSIMIAAYKRAEKPEIFGISETHYYNLRFNKWLRWTHPRRASLFCTMLRTGLNIDWPTDGYLPLDMYLWKRLQGRTFAPDNVIALGMKHGEGLCGGKGHEAENMYTDADPDRSFLKETVDEESYNFYGTKN
jgi:hypothetical protein